MPLDFAQRRADSLQQCKTHTVFFRKVAMNSAVQFLHRIFDSVIVKAKFCARFTPGRARENNGDGTAIAPISSIEIEEVVMKKTIILTALLLASGIAAYAQAPGEHGWGPRMGWGQGMGWGGYGMGPGMMQGGAGPCGGWTGPGGAPAQVTEENAKAAVTQYAEKYFKGYKVERLLPFAAMNGMTMYQAELSGPNGESRILHVNPWGNVMPFGGPQARTR